MVLTTKFSQFTPAVVTNSGNQYAGLGGGANIIGNEFNSWNTAGRPSAPYNGLMGYNTDLDQWEYWNGGSLKWLQFLTTTNGLDWEVVTDVSIGASVNSGFITNRTVTPVTILLPAIFDIGDVVEVMGLGAGGWSLVANAGQSIVFGSQTTSVAGAINSDITNSNIIVKGLVPNVTWSVTSINSNPTII